jgi:BirA family biotin operon repressor/biotin-[acetyl-CoA-carboxylase] ligase
LINCTPQEGLSKILSGYRVYSFDEVSSTNDVINEIAEMDAEAKLCVVARTQSHGRGRRGSPWVSLNGGLWFSISLYSRDPPSDAVKLTFIMGTAVVEVASEIGIQAALKWPNDILVDGKKLCGILSTGKVSHGVMERVIIGVGLNANVDPASFPSHLRGSVTSLSFLCGHEVDLLLVLEDILNRFEVRRQSLQSGHWLNLLQEWKRHASFLGARIGIVGSTASIVGEAWDIDVDGSLLMKLDDGTTRRIMEGSLRLCIES